MAQTVSSRSRTMWRHGSDCVEQKQDHVETWLRLCRAEAGPCGDMAQTCEGTIAHCLSTIDCTITSPETIKPSSGTHPLTCESVVGGGLPPGPLPPGAPPSWGPSLTDNPVAAAPGLTDDVPL
uniref:Uncharacterized protein n=1 Tax=Knipowitschia caucasica TaxID=637954 RepID=A0AAV2L0G6_KNICA